MHKKELLIAAGLVALAFAGRLLPHLPDATPLTAVTLASAVYLGRRWALMTPLLVVFVSDLFLGFYDWRIMASVYGSWLVIGFLGFMLERYPGVLSIAALTLGSSLLFFVITNFAVWAFSPWYPKDLAGLLYCYEMGLPFLRNMMLGDLLYTPLLLGMLGVVRGFIRAKSPAYAK